MALHAHRQALNQELRALVAERDASDLRQKLISLQKDACLVKLDANQRYLAELDARKRRLVRTNRSNLTLAGGVVFTTERYRASTECQKNTEGLAAVRFSMFRFDSTNIAAESLVYPRITTPGRLRVDTNVSGKIDLTHSVNVTLRLYSFDSRPPVHVPRMDAGLNIGFGWAF